MPFTFTNAFGDTVTVTLEPYLYVYANWLAILAFDSDGSLYSELTVNLVVWPKTELTSYTKPHQTKN